MRRTVRWFLGCAFGLVVVLGAATLWTEVEAAKPSPCGCPTGGAKVWCDGGQRFNNMCLADCAGATGCVEIPILPPS
ncbi:MAG TPA: hypothetical protein VF139_06500 [Candidatus Polarisedimenticolaceae bacterium]